MTTPVQFSLKLTGDTSDNHQFQGYDGYMSLAGFAWTLSLIANFTETGKIRSRGEFAGREAVRASPIAQGSIIADFTVWLTQDPSHILSAGVITSGLASAFFYDLVNRILSRNLGEDSSPSTPLLKSLVSNRSGDLEALVAKAEPAIRQTHSVIGSGAKKIEIRGGHNIINTFDSNSKEYVRSNIEEGSIREKEFSVAAFNANSGYGSVFDDDLERTIPISMSKDVLRKYRHIFTWGLDQYATDTGGKITMKYRRILAMDGTPKKYVVTSASKMK